MPPPAQTRGTSELALPDPPPADAPALALWLQTALKLDRPANTIKTEPAKPLPFGGETRLTQPARWTISFGGPQRQIQAEAWAGNRSVTIRTVESGFIATLMNMHKGTGMPLVWILLVDTLAGSLILLSISGLALWMLSNHRRRALGLAVFGAALTVTAGLALSQL